MNEVSEFFRKILEVNDWPARWFCGIWTDFHGWLYIGSDLAIWMAYFAIPIVLISFVQKRPDMPLLPIFWLFGAFIVLCGMTHLVDAVIFWWPAYRVSALVRFTTALVSWTTVFAMIRYLPKALRLRSTTELEEEIALRRNAQEELKATNKELERILSVMGDRELEMAALKEEVKKLKTDKK